MEDKPEIVEVFIAYRRGPTEGDSYVANLAKCLEDSPLLIDGRLWGKIRVFFDRTTPATSDWTRYWGVKLKTARAFVLVSTAGAAQRRTDRDDVLYKEIDWWVSHRREAPIIVDAHGLGRAAVPAPILANRRWRNIEWLDWPANGESLERLCDRIRSGIVLSKVGVDAQELRRLRWRNRMLAALSLGLAFAFYLMMQARNAERSSRRVAELTTIQAKRDAQLAEQSRSFLGKTFEEVTKSSPGKPPDIGQIVQAAARQIDADPQGDPIAHANLQYTVGMMCLSAGDLGQAERLLSDAYGTFKNVLGENHLYLLAAMSGLGQLFFQQHKYDRAESILRAAMNKMELQVFAKETDRLAVVNNLATTLLARGKYDEAAKLFDQSLKTDVRVMGLNDPARLQIMENLARVEVKRARYARAEELVKPVIEWRNRTLPEDHPDRIGTHALHAEILEGLERREEANLVRARLAQVTGDRTGNGSAPIADIDKLRERAAALAAASKVAEAEFVWREAIESRRRKLGEGHPELALYAIELARLLLEVNKFAEAETEYKKAITELSKDRSPDRSQFELLRTIRYELSVALHRQEKLEEMAEVTRLVLESYRTEGQKYAKEITTLEHNLASTLLRLGKKADARKLLESAHPEHQRIFGTDDVSTLLLENKLANLYIDIKEYGKAEDLERHIFAELQKQKGYAHVDTQKVLVRLITVLVEQAKGEGLSQLFKLVPAEQALALNELIMSVVMHRTIETNRFETAIPLLEALVQSQKLVLLPENRWLSATKFLLADCYVYTRARGKAQEAERLVRDVIANLHAPGGVAPAMATQTDRVLGTALRLQGRFAEAEPSLLKALSRDGKLKTPISEQRLILKEIVELYRGWLAAEQSNQRVRDQLRTYEDRLEQGGGEKKSPG